MYSRRNLPLCGWDLRPSVSPLDDLPGLVDFSIWGTHTTTAGPLIHIVYRGGEGVWKRSKMRKIPVSKRFLSSFATLSSFSSSISPFRCFSSSRLPHLNDNLTLNDFIQQNKPDLKIIPSSNRSKHMKNLSFSQGEGVGQPNTPNPSLKFFIETYGCQMNISDSEIVRSVLLDAGHVTCDDIEIADIIIANTCAIRENAEAKVWHRLHYFKSIKNKNKVGKLKPGHLILLVSLISSSSQGIRLLGC
jgi:hypothetical protein